MGILSWLFKGKSNRPKIEDRVWMSQSAKYIGIGKWAKEEILAGKTVVLIAFFSDTMREMQEILFSRHISAEEISGVYELKKNKIHIIQAKNLKGLPHKDLQIAVSLFFIEHFPLHEEEDSLLEILQNFSSPIYFGTALDEPLMQKISSNLIGLMERMGMSQDEYLSHTFISKSIRNLQEKISKSVIITPHTANSAKEWLDAIK